MAENQRQTAEDVRSVVAAPTNGPLLAEAARLWIKADDVVVDVTYGKGNFWTHYRPDNLVTHDLALDGVDFRQLPEPDASADVVVFDPPYVEKGRGRSTEPVFLGRFGIDEPRTIYQIESLIVDGMKECSRLLRPGGRLLVKCMDYISSRRYIQGHHLVVTAAAEFGLRQVDEFVHHSGPGPMPTRRGEPVWSRGFQQHSKRVHSFLCVFRVPMRPSVIPDSPVRARLDRCPHSLITEDRMCGICGHLLAEDERRPVAAPTGKPND